MNPIWEYTIKLIRFVLNGDVPELPENIDFEQLFAFGRSHGVENMLYVGLRDLNINVPKETMQKFKTAYEMQIMIEATQALEFKNLSDAFCKAEIDFLPLKGIVIRDLYPMPDYRKSNDIDILIRPGDETEVHALMIENGYELIERDHVNLHLEYKKPPFLLVEIHLRMVETDNRAYNFFSNIWSMAVPSAEPKHMYIMEDECFYTFIIAHLCKHIRNGGAGIKFIADIWILLKHFKYDEQKLEQILKKANIAQFETWTRDLTYWWFGNGEPNDRNVYTLSSFIAESGSYGTLELNKRIHAGEVAGNIHSRVLYRCNRLWHSTFLSYNAMKVQYPFIEKYRVLYPVTWFMRILRMLTKEKRSVSDMVYSSAHIDVDKSKQLSEIWNAVKEI